MTGSALDADVVIVGAGPAGSSLAARLGRSGRKVILLDRAHFPRAKACGECLNPGAVAALERLGVASELRALNPAPLAGWSLGTAEGPRASGFFAPGSAGGLALPRRELDALLVRTARKAGARLLEGARVRGLREDRVGVAVKAEMEDGATRLLCARVVVGADGLRSVVARQMGLLRRRPRLVKASATFRLAGRVRPERPSGGPGTPGGTLFLGPGFTVGLAPVAHDGTRWNGTLVVDPAAWGRALAHDPRALFLRLLARAPVGWSEGPVVTDGPWTSGPFDWPCSLPARGAVATVGDAAGYYDPLTGQGIYRALRSTELAEPHIERGLNDPNGPASALRAYGRALAREFGPGRRLQWLIEACLSSNRLRPGVVAGLARSEEALSALIRVTGDARRARSLIHPGLWLSVVRPRRAWQR